MIGGKDDCMMGGGWLNVDVDVVTIGGWLLYVVFIGDCLLILVKLTLLFCNCGLTPYILLPTNLYYCPTNLLTFTSSYNWYTLFCNIPLFLIN